MKKILMAATLPMMLGAGLFVAGLVHAAVIPDRHHYAYDEYCLQGQPICREIMDQCYTQGWLAPGTEEFPEWKSWDVVKQCMEQEVTRLGGYLDQHKGAVIPAPTQ